MFLFLCIQLSTFLNYNEYNIYTAHSHHDDMGAFGMDIPIGIGQSYDSPSLGLI